MSKKLIPVCEPLLSGNEKLYLNSALDTNWISSQGQYLSMFEEAFANYCGVKYSTAVSNGTNAIHLGLKALGIQEGDEVIVPNFTMICSALPVCYLKAMPVFVDSEMDTWNINPALIETKITSKTKAIMVVHIYGHSCDMNPIKALAEKYSLKIIEDAAEVHGAEYFGTKCGNLGDISAFSFFANKIITTGEGGMVLTNDKELFERVKYYKDLCFPLTGERSYKHEDIGFQYRLSNLQAAIGLAQVERVDYYVEKRRFNNKLYQEYLNGIEGIIFQTERIGCKNVFWMNAIVIDPKIIGINRDELMQELYSKGIQTRKFFVPMHCQPALIKYGIDTSDSYPVSNWLAENGLYLPSGSGLTENEIIYICDKIKNIIANRNMI
jgi:perosamine synthetase